MLTDFQNPSNRKINTSCENVTYCTLHQDHYIYVMKTVEALKFPLRVYMNHYLLRSIELTVK